MIKIKNSYLRHLENIKNDEEARDLLQGLLNSGKIFKDKFVVIVGEGENQENVRYVLFKSVSKEYLEGFKYGMNITDLDSNTYKTMTFRRGLKYGIKIYKDLITQYNFVRECCIDLK